MKVKFENCVNYSLSSVVNRPAGLGCSSSCAGHDCKFWVVTKKVRWEELGVVGLGEW